MTDTKNLDLKIQGIHLLLNRLEILEEFGVKKSLKFEEIKILCEKTIHKIIDDQDQKDLPL